MLLVDPLKRITIPEVRRHPWFAARLPRYLAAMQADPAMARPRVDADAVEEVRGSGGLGLGARVLRGGGGVGLVGVEVGGDGVS